MGAPLGHAGQHRQHRLGTVQRLDLGLSRPRTAPRRRSRRVVVETRRRRRPSPRTADRGLTVLDMGEVEAQIRDAGRTQAAALGHRARPSRSHLMPPVATTHPQPVRSVRRRPTGRGSSSCHRRHRATEPPAVPPRSTRHPQSWTSTCSFDSHGHATRLPTHRQDLRRRHPPSPSPHSPARPRSTWINQVERWFGLSSTDQRCIRRGVAHARVQRTGERHPAACDPRPGHPAPRPFTWPSRPPINASTQLPTTSPRQAQAHPTHSNYARNF